MALLNVSGLGVTIGAEALLRDVSFEIAAGEVLGLAGESGSGKSLTALAVSRLLPATATATGAVRFEGQELLAMPESALCAIRGRGIGLVFQEPATALNPLLTIGAQVAETVRIHLPVSRAEAQERAARALGRVGLDPARIPLDRYPHQLSGGQRQRVALALAVALTPKLLIADEPTTALDVTTQAQILALLRELAAADGMAILLVSHDLAVVAEMADRLAILHRGAIVEAGRTGSVLRSPRHPYTAALVRDYTPVALGVRARGPAASPLLEALGIVREYPGSRTGFLSRAPAQRAVDGVSLTIGPGERVGLVGESGSGKSTLVRTLLALEAPDRGSVRVAGETLAARPTLPQRRLRRLLQVVFQDPYGSLNPRHRIERIVAEPLHLLDGPLSRPERAARVAAALVAVGLEPGTARRFPHEFSGGQRQRIAIARALVVEPRLVILDEAVSALDASLRTQILELLGRLSEARGLAYLFVSHDLGVVRAVTDRTLVMQAGRIVEEGTTEQVLLAPRHPYTQALVAATPNLERALAGRASGA
jgi:peptide/nickel transport system ATP-binding protein